MKSLLVIGWCLFTADASSATKFSSRLLIKSAVAATLKSLGSTKTLGGVSSISRNRLTPGLKVAPLVPVRSFSSSADTKPEEGQVPLDNVFPELFKAAESNEKLKSELETIIKLGRDRLERINTKPEESQAQKERNAQLDELLKLIRSNPEFQSELLKLLKQVQDSSESGIPKPANGQFDFQSEVLIRLKELRDFSKSNNHDLAKMTIQELFILLHEKINSIKEEIIKRVGVEKFNILNSIFKDVIEYQNKTISKKILDKLRKLIFIDKSSSSTEQCTPHSKCGSDGGSLFWPVIGTITLVTLYSAGSYVIHEIGVAFR